ncbi:MAG: hypothetical protein C0596_06490 [Marinilabiliales bacterium]|nr:MAG: hypothetical protein C0596_06490 [Marinilabiliales bacterium]
MNIECIKTYIEVVALLVGIPFAFYQVYLLIKQLKFSTVQMAEQTDWNRKNATFQYIDIYTTELKGINRKVLSELVPKGSGTDSISEQKLKKLLENPTFRANILRIVAYFDNLSLGINNKYYDNQIASDSLIVVATDTFVTLKPYIELRRKELNIEIASNFEKLYNRWKNEIVPIK